MVCKTMLGADFIGKIRINFVLLTLCLFVSLDISHMIDSRTPEVREAGAVVASVIEELENGADSSQPLMKPAFLAKYGQEGINYDFDDQSRPYILCEYVAPASCDPSKGPCHGKKKCYSEGKHHERLGCMAVTDNQQKNGSFVKDCWPHSDSIHMCLSGQCTAERRSAVHVDVFFCCCATHNCNLNVFIPQESSTFTPPVLPSMIEDRGLFSTDTWAAVFMFTAFIFTCLLLILFYWTYRELKNSHLFKDKTDGNYPTLAFADIDTPLIGCKKDEGWRDINSLEMVACGRFGQVYRGSLDGLYIAVKVFTAADASSWMIEQEIYAIPALRRHNNILKYIGSEVHGSAYWLITEFHQTGTLQDFLKSHIVSINGALKIISSLLKGLAFLHEEKMIDNEFKPCIVHRDFKSRNILLKMDLTAVICDFGLALKCENGLMPTDEYHGQVGTRRFMAPEVLEGATEFTAFAFRQIDVYAAALVLWEILSRTALQEGDGVHEYKQPYEEQAGEQPTLYDLRRIVVAMKIRPSIRQQIKEHNITAVLWKTVEDMWDTEPDGRITSGCAHERANTLYMSYSSSAAHNDCIESTAFTNSCTPSQTDSSWSSRLSDEQLALNHLPALPINNTCFPFNSLPDDVNMFPPQKYMVPPNMNFDPRANRETSNLSYGHHTHETSVKEKHFYSNMNKSELTSDK